MTDKIIAIHQPNFMPWAGYFLKIAACGIFVLHDNVQINKSAPTRRVKIASKNAHSHEQWLTVPLKQHSDFALIKDLQISWDTDWTKNHLNQIKENYLKCPYFDLYYPMITMWYKEAKSFTLLRDMNRFYIYHILNLLDIQKEILLSSHLPVTGKSSAYNVAITKHMNGSIYLSGIGADKYQDEQSFIENHIILKKLDAKAELEQAFNGLDFQVHFSIIDLLMKIDIDIIKRGFSNIRI